MLSGRLYRAETMPPVRSFLTRLTRPTISSRRDLVRYVLLVNMFGLVAAFAIDITQQLLFFTTWAAALRSWAVTIAAVTVIATPVATCLLGRNGSCSTPRTPWRISAGPIH